MFKLIAILAIFFITSQNKILLLFLPYVFLKMSWKYISMWASKAILKEQNNINTIAHETELSGNLRRALPFFLDGCETWKILDLSSNVSTLKQFMHSYIQSRLYKYIYKCFAELRVRWRKDPVKWVQLKAITH